MFSVAELIEMDRRLDQAERYVAERAGALKYVDGKIGICAEGVARFERIVADSRALIQAAIVDVESGRYRGPGRSGAVAIP